MRARPFRLALWLLCAAPLAAGAQGVALHAESPVAGEFFSLGEIAAVEADDPALAGLRIGRSPRVGRVLEVTRADVASTLLHLRPDLAGRLQLNGPERIRVLRGPLEKIAYERLHDEARAALEKALALQYERYELEARGEARAPLLVPAGRIELRSRVPEVLAGRVSVWTDVLVDGRHYQSVPVAFEVRGLPERPAPARRPGAAVAVKQGDPVTVRFASGAIAVETVALAMRPAQAGEVIRVRNAETNQTYRARVVAPGTVETLWR